MAEICIYIPLEPYLRDWFIHLHGGNYPVRLMRGCAESDVLAKALMRQPEGEHIPKPEEGDVAIVIPQFRHRDPVYFNYLPKHGKLALLQVIRHNFDFDMWVTCISLATSASVRTILSTILWRQEALP